MRYINSVGTIRKLAKTPKFQIIYSNAKEAGLKIFRNNGDYTDLQLLFLNFLSLYSTLNLDIALGEIDDIVLDNEIYEDAYLFHKRKSRGDKNEDLNKTMHNYNRPHNATKPKYTETQQSTWVFKTPPKEKK